jgi:hypothetical protein
MSDTAATEPGLNGSLERYERYQREVRSGARRPPAGRPREFDESGFPVPQRHPSFVERVARQLNPL